MFKTILDLIPRGLTPVPTTNFFKLLKGLAKELQRVYIFIKQVSLENTPKTSEFMKAEWLDFLGADTLAIAQEYFKVERNLSTQKFMTALMSIDSAITFIADTEIELDVSGVFDVSGKYSFNLNYNTIVYPQYLYFVGNNEINTEFNQDATDGYRDYNADTDPPISSPYNSEMDALLFSDNELILKRIERVIELFSPYHIILKKRLDKTRNRVRVIHQQIN